MAIITSFPWYSTQENIATNNTMLLLGQVYRIDPRLFETFLASTLGVDEFQIGPSFSQQKSNGGDGIPDALIFQQSFGIVIEAKRHDEFFWGKERYTSHFKDESIRILLTVSKKDMNGSRVAEFKKNLIDFDKGRSGRTIHKHVTFSGLVNSLRSCIESSRTRYKLEFDELVEDYERFLDHEGLIDDEYMRMSVVPVRLTWRQNLENLLYYNSTRFTPSAHKYLGLYFHKEVRYVAVPTVVLIPVIDEKEKVQYTFLKGKENFTEPLRNKFEAFLKEFVAEEGYGGDGGLRYYLVDEWHETHFKKESPGGIMGPRHCYLPDYIEGLKQEHDAAYVADKLNDQVWDIG
jgi:hypothetical protein